MDSKLLRPSWFFIVPAPEGFLQVISREFNESRSQNAYLVPFLTPNKHALFQRPSQNYSPTFSLVPVQKIMNTYANPGALLMKRLPPGGFTSPSVQQIADFKQQDLQH